MKAPSVLIIRFSAIGDCVMATYLATAIRLRHPDARIAFACETRFMPVVDTATLIGPLVEVPRARWKQMPAWRRFRERMRLYRSLRDYKFDFGFDLQGHSKTALCLRMARPRVRAAVGGTDAFARKLNPIPPTADPSEHFIERQFEVARAMERLEIPSRPVMPDVGENAEGLTPGYVAIPTSAGPGNKAYPIHGWNDVGRALVSSGERVVFVGGPGDPSPNVPGCVDLVDKLSLDRTMSILRDAKLVVAADTGGGHIAAAYGVPTLSIFGPTDPAKCRPWGPNAQVLRNGPLSADTSPAQVLSKVEEMLR